MLFYVLSCFNLRFDTSFFLFQIVREAVDPPFLGCERFFSLT